jgi:Histone H1-like protein Hc1
MALKDTCKTMRTLLETIMSDLEKAESGIKAASQRVRTTTIKFEKVAKLYRKESIKADKSGLMKKTKEASRKKTAAPAKKAAPAPAVAKKAAPAKRAPAKKAPAPKKKATAKLPKRKKR